MAGFKESEVEAIIAAVKAWTKQQPEIYAVALVGSWARNKAHENSDIDLMILTLNPERFFLDTNWFNNIPWHKLNLQLAYHYDRTYGLVRSRHLFFEQGQRIEFRFGHPNWACINPIDPGTLAVISSGIKIICDRDRLLTTLLEDKI